MDDIPGYRIVRRLGTGSRAVVHLAHGAGGAPPVALKVFLDDTPASDMDREATVLASVSSEHVVALLDVCGMPGAARALALDRLQTESLGWLLRSRQRLSLGEAVTVTVSIARGVRALHEAGFAHGTLGAARVLFGPGHRPVIAGLGHALALDAERGDEFRREDWQRYGNIAHAVFERVDVLGREADIAEIRAALDAVTARRARDADHDRLEDALFALTPPAPVAVRRIIDGHDALRESAPSAMRTAALEARAAPGRRAAVSEGHSPPPDRGSTRVKRAGAHSDAVSGNGAAAVVRRTTALAGRVLENGASAVIRENVRTLVHTRRRPIIAAAIVTSVLVLGAVTLLPTDRTAGARGDGHKAAATPAAASTPGPSRPDATAGTGMPAAADRATAATDDPSASRDPVSSDDPVAAATSLLDIRRRCLRASDPECLGSVDEAGSPQQTADDSRISGAGDAEEPDYAAYTVSLIERIGGSALLALAPPHGTSSAKPATALAIKSGAGWRIRTIYLS